MDVLPALFETGTLRAAVLHAAELGDPAVRAQLPAAVCAHPSCDALPREVWQQVGHALAATSRAAEASLDGAEASTTGPARDVRPARGHARRARDGPFPLGCGGHPAHVAAGAAAEQPCEAGNGAVEQSWARLAEFLLDPGPVEPDRLAVALHRHHAALAAWRRVLLGVVRVHRAQPGC